MRLRLEDEVGLLKSTTDVELQKLKVVPQTVFLKTRSPEPLSRFGRAYSISRRSLADNVRPLTFETSYRGSQPPSVDHGSTGAPFEDLRRRLSAFNGSGTSLQSPVPRPSSLMSTPVSPRPPVSSNDLPAVFDRPNSPSESVLSTTTSARPVQRLQIGSTDTKAAPAIGSSRANATGVLEATSKMRSDGSPERSGRTSPVSVADTVRGQRRPSVLPISTYGECMPAFA
jgi:phosphoinositide-3-kinase regulatory subunit 4